MRPVDPPRSSLRRLTAALQGLVLALGAPLGLLLLRAVLEPSVSRAWLVSELSRNAWTYGYVLASTAIVFAGFGYALGRATDRMAELSRTDPLTALWNRRYLQERLDQEFARSRRSGLPFALLLFDLDGLKALNDDRGHRAGDAALKQVAAALRDGARSSDVAGRWGGDEFVLLAPDADVVDATALAERVRTLVSAPGASSAVTVSVGIACDTTACPARDGEDLMRLADTALYAAKRAGGDRIGVDAALALVMEGGEGSAPGGRRR